MKKFFLWMLLLAPILLLAQESGDRWVRVQSRASDVHQDAEMSWFVLYAKIAPGNSRLWLARFWLPDSEWNLAGASRFRGRYADPDRVEVGEILVLFVYPWELDTWPEDLIDKWRSECDNPEHFDEVLKSADYYRWLHNQELVKK